MLLAFETTVPTHPSIRVSSLVNVESSCVEDQLHPFSTMKQSEKHIDESSPEKSHSPTVSSQDSTDVEVKGLLWRIDLHIVPPVTILYLLSFL